MPFIMLSMQVKYGRFGFFRYIMLGVSRAKRNCGIHYFSTQMNHFRHFNERW